MVPPRRIPLNALYPRKVNALCLRKVNAPCRRKAKTRCLRKPNAPCLLTIPRVRLHPRGNPLTRLKLRMVILPYILLKLRMDILPRTLLKPRMVIPTHILPQDRHTLSLSQMARRSLIWLNLPNPVPCTHRGMQALSLVLWEVYVQLRRVLLLDRIPTFPGLILV